MQAVALFRAQALGDVLDQRAIGRRQLELAVELAQQQEDFPVRGRQAEPFVVRKGFGDRVGPVVQVLQVAVLVEGDVLPVHQ
ncbi:hypothetical protein D3C80_2055940 [compost metagenome]